LAAAGMAVRKLSFAWGSPFIQPLSEPLGEFDYRDVSFASGPHDAQLAQTQAVVLDIDEDSLLKPFRGMAGMPAPGLSMGGWYEYNPDYNFALHDDPGMAPGHMFGQWVSALARAYAINGSQATRAKMLRLNRAYAQTISTAFYEKTRWPAYTYDKLVCGLIDSHQFGGDPDAFAILERTTDAALPQLPPHAIERETPWRPGKTDISWSWDESYTMPENLFLAYQRGAGARYRDLAVRYLHDKPYFDPLAEGQDPLPGKHAYSYINALSSAMQAYFVLGSEKHLRAAKNAFTLLRTTQSFATGGWGPDEMLRPPGSGELGASLANTHQGFETPCGSYAHFKLTRYLLRATGDPHYGDSMEQVMYNTVLGARELRPDGTAFYYSDYNFDGKKTDSDHKWPCCAGTLPQVAADYRISTYFRDRRGVYVNLYIPSTLQWVQNGVQIALTQQSRYPFDGIIRFDIKTSSSSAFALRLRIPEWAGSGVNLSVNGAFVPSPESGSFATIERTWKSGDRVELELPLRTRLMPVDPQHPMTQALLCGPLVLFAIADGAPPVAAIHPPPAIQNGGHGIAVTAAQLLAAERSGPAAWQVHTANGPLTMLPFLAISDERYSTYLVVT
jgi:uncharacterized protein